MRACGTKISSLIIWLDDSTASRLTWSSIMMLALVVPFLSRSFRTIPFHFSTSRLMVAGKSYRSRNERFQTTSVSNRSGNEQPRQLGQSLVHQSLPIYGRWLLPIRTMIILDWRSPRDGTLTRRVLGWRLWSCRSVPSHRPMRSQTLQKRSCFALMSLLQCTTRRFSCIGN